MARIPLFKVHVSDIADKQVTETLYSGMLTQGPRVVEFENELANFLGVEHLFAVNSATSGLSLALQLLSAPDADTMWPGLKQGDQVLSPALTCTATTWPILHAGFQPVWLDVEEGSCSVSISDIERKLTEKTKIVQILHWGGTAVDVDSLAEMLDRAEKRLGFRPRVIEDCAHAFGACYPRRGNKVGTSGNICVFSFQAIKLLTTGDGGCVVTPTEGLKQRGKLLRWYGIDREKKGGKGDSRLEGDVPIPGYKYNMNDLAAALGLANLPSIPRLLETNRANAATLYERLDGVVKFLNYDPKSSFWLLSINVDCSDSFREHMESYGIAASQVHKRNDLHSCVANFRSDLPGLDALTKTMSCIPVGFWLSKDDVEEIATAVEAYPW